MTLAQLGADVVRIDPIGGAPDFTRWPLSARSNRSLFWDGLNKGKRSVTIDVRQPEGRDLVLALAAAPGPDAGILLENQAGRPWLTYDALTSRRADAIQVHIEGHSDGRSAVDYTVNAEVGLPWLTGMPESAAPVNHVLPAWDLLAGTTAVTGLLAALRRRDRTADGSYIAVALADVALASLAGMGWLAEADERGSDRERVGNYLYGSFGVDAVTLDGERVIVVALTARHWRALVAATGTGAVFAALEGAFGVDLDDEGERYRQREVLAAVLRPWFAARDLAAVGAALDAARALWGRYGRMSEVVAAVRNGTGAPILADVEQPGTGAVISSRSPLRIDGSYGLTSTAPRLGCDTDEVLAEVLGLTDAELGRLHDSATIGEGTQ
jgi:2-methylfumaryl-CoA isomerase